MERQQVDRIQPQLQHVNAVGQGLIQSAAKHTDTQALEHDLETTNLQWNSLNKRVGPDTPTFTWKHDQNQIYVQYITFVFVCPQVAERIAQLQEALLHCGKFQDALEPLLSWLSDTEELVANQKPPSAEYRVVKAQIQEQKVKEGWMSSCDKRRRRTKERSSETQTTALKGFIVLHEYFCVKVCFYVSFNGDIQTSSVSFNH